MTPTVAIVLGPAGSGKSRVSAALARRLGAAHLDKDTIVGGLTEAILAEAGHDPGDRDNNPWYTATVMPLEYAALHRVAGDCLRAGTSVVLDAPYGAFLDEDGFPNRVATEFGWPSAQWVVVRVVTDKVTVRRRVTERGYSRDAWKLAHWDEFWARVGERECRWSDVEIVRVDNNGDSPDLAALDSVRA